MAAASAGTIPGTRPATDGRVSSDDVTSSIAAASTEGLGVIVNERGRISASSDALGTTDTSGTLTIQKPIAGKVRKAVLLAASTGYSGSATGTVSIDGTPVTLGHETPSYINSYNYWADVTAVVRQKLDTALVGSVPFVISESDAGSVDGVILSVIFDDPNQASESSVTLLFGATQTGGDSFTLNLSRPMDPMASGSLAQMALGISFGYQADGTQQYSTIDVNGRRLTSAAGGEDDGQSINGALVTVGGFGDLPFNPPDPSATPVGPRSDDELYDLRPFIRTGDSSIHVTTSNPSRDDNIFFALFATNPPVTDVVTPRDPAVGPYAYVALGDSFSAGEGMNPYFEPSNKCHRSPAAYSSLVRLPWHGGTIRSLSQNPDTGVKWGFQACSGAVAKNLTNDDAGRYDDPIGQLKVNRSLDTGNANDLPVDGNTDLVTLTIGGNDVEFSNVLKFCALRRDCHAADYKGRSLNQFQRDMRDSLAPKLTSIYERIRYQAPRARILVLGYPQLFPATTAEQSCAKLREYNYRDAKNGVSAYVGFSPAEQNAMRRWTSELNQTIADRVIRHGTAEFLPVAAHFAGHEVCGSSGEWINALSFDLSPAAIRSGAVVRSQAFHPNPRGQAEGYAAVINEHLTVSF